jgi:hypothetical protein
MHEHQSYSDMSGVQLDDGAFVLRWCLHKKKKIRKEIKMSAHGYRPSGVS